MKGKFFSRGLMLLMLILLTGMARIVGASGLNRFFDPVEVPGDVLSGCYGYPLDHLRLYAVKNGAPAPIPFQIDERDVVGNFILPEGPEGSRQGENLKLDTQDLLVFMARDAGGRAEAANKLPGETSRLEITLTDPSDQSQAWVYLVYFESEVPPPHPEQRVKITLEKELAVTTGAYTYKCLNNKIGRETYHTCFPNYYTIAPAVGGRGENILDRLKFRIRGKFLGFIPLLITEYNCRSAVSKYKVGPIRGLVTEWLEVPLPLHLNRFVMVRETVDYYFYDHMCINPFRGSLPQWAGILAPRLSLELGMDLSPQACGMTGAISNQKNIFIVDGVMSAEEKAMSDEYDRWRYITGPQGSVVSRYVLDKRLEQLAKVMTSYVDDFNAVQPEETYPGQLGHLATINHGFERLQSWHVNYLDTYIPPFFYQMDNSSRMEVIRKILNFREQPLKIKVGEDELINEAAQVLPLIHQ